MSINSGATRMFLTAGRTVRLRRARGLKVACLRGTVWITQDGDLRDIIVGSGEAFTVDRDGLLLIHAFGAAAIAIEGASSTISTDGLALSTVCR